MDSFKLRGNADAGHTLVSNEFLDNYMPAANGEYVKVYLYLLRCLDGSTRELSISILADRFERTESDIKRALAYWEKVHLLKLEYDDSDTLTGVCITEGSSAYATSNTDESGSSDSKDNLQKERGSLNAPPKGSISAALLTPDEKKQLLFICEQYLGKTLSSQDTAKILYFHDVLGFDPDLIEYLIEYCVSHRHKSLRYIETVAQSWHDKGYVTAEQAKSETSTYSKDYFSILRAFGITNRSPVDVEIKYMNKWLREYGFTLDIVIEACSRTMAAIHQPGFEYADKILNRWHQSGVKILSDVDSLDQKRVENHVKRQCSEKPSSPRAKSPNRFHNYKERDYDFDELQKKLINT